MGFALSRWIGFQRWIAPRQLTAWIFSISDAPERASRAIAPETPHEPNDGEYGRIVISTTCKFAFLFAGGAKKPSANGQAWPQSVDSLLDFAGLSNLGRRKSNSARLKQRICALRRWLSGKAGILRRQTFRLKPSAPLGVFNSEFGVFQF